MRQISVLRVDLCYVQPTGKRSLEQSLELAISTMALATPVVPNGVLLAPVPHNLGTERLCSLPSYEEATSHWVKVWDVPQRSGTDRANDIVVYGDYTGAPECTWLFTDTSTGTIFLCHRVPRMYLHGISIASRLVFVYFPELQTHMPLQQGCDNFDKCVEHLEQAAPGLAYFVDAEGYLHLKM